MNAKRFICIVLALLAFSGNMFAYALPGEDHDRYMLMVLFGESISESEFSEDEQKALEALEASSYLAIDQYNDNGKINSKGSTALETLRRYRVPDIPSSIDQINYTDNQHHRRYTHRGWNGPYRNEERPYQDDRANWNVRKRILKSTVNKIFGFNKILGNVPFATKFSTDYGTKCDSLSAIIYHVHILGDHIVETDPTQMNTDLIPAGGRNDDFSIIDEMIYHGKRVFANSNKYSAFKSELLLLNNDFYTLTDGEGVNTVEKQLQYAALSQQLMDLLIDKVPDMLKEEKFFTDAFPTIK